MNQALLFIDYLNVLDVEALALAVDGTFGPQAKRMIVAFEHHEKISRRLFIADGIVESSRKTASRGRGSCTK